jgi:SpoVK/Ycf46/Vps4 family AAA+-type ATPase
VKDAVDKHYNAPILFFNEADGVLGKRQTLSGERSGPGQTENAIQNIILDEMENLSGIMVCTTNMTDNLDAAFERRFLYKVNFEKPGNAAREAIWQSLIPGLDSEIAASLAAQYDFSGGQIENIARKRSIDSILNDIEPDFSAMENYCREERLAGKEPRRIGFVV